MLEQTKWIFVISEILVEIYVSSYTQITQLEFSEPTNADFRSFDLLHRSNRGVGVWGSYEIISP